MMRELVSLAGTLGIFEESRDHDRAVEYMRDHPLQDGCPAKEFADRCRDIITLEKQCAEADANMADAQQSTASASTALVVAPS